MIVFAVGAEDNKVNTHTGGGKNKQQLFIDLKIACQCVLSLSVVTNDRKKTPKKLVCTGKPSLKMISEDRRELLQEIWQKKSSKGQKWIFFYLWVTVARLKRMSSVITRSAFQSQLPLSTTRSVLGWDMDIVPSIFLVRGSKCVQMRFFNTNGHYTYVWSQCSALTPHSPPPAVCDSVWLCRGNEMSNGTLKWNTVWKIDVSLVIGKLTKVRRTLLIFCEYSTKALRVNYTC